MGLSTIKEMSLLIQQLEILSQEQKTFSNTALHFIASGKTIFEENGIIYRVSKENDAATRIGLVKYAKDSGINIFQEEEVIPELSNNIFWTTSQKKLAIDQKRSSDEEILVELKKQLKESEYNRFLTFIKDTGFMWFGCNYNYGRTEVGDIKIFDWIANVSVRKIKDKYRLFTNNNRRIEYLWKPPL